METVVEWGGGLEGEGEIVGAKASIYCQEYEFIVKCENRLTITLITLVDEKNRILEVGISSLPEN